ncbi:hypothetical protein ACS0TY_012620 [Phlomoides rotata]
MAEAMAARRALIDQAYQLINEFKSRQEEEKVVKDLKLLSLRTKKFDEEEEEEEKKKKWEKEKEEVENFFFRYLLKL